MEEENKNLREENTKLKESERELEVLKSENNLSYSAPMQKLNFALSPQKNGAKRVWLRLTAPKQKTAGDQPRQTESAERRCADAV